MSIFNFWKLWKMLIIVKYGYISHPTPWSQEHSVIMGLAAYEVPAKLCSGCAGCIPWESPAASPPVLSLCNMGWEQSSAMTKVNSHSTAWDSTAIPGTASKAGRHWCCWWVVGLEEGTELVPVISCWLQSTPCHLRTGRYLWKLLGSLLSLSRGLLQRIKLKFASILPISC